MRARSLLVPVLFGVALIGIAFVTRSGYFGRDNPGLPINSAMRQALGHGELPEEDRAIVAQRYPNAEVTPSGLRYVVDRPGDGPRPQRGQTIAVHYRGTLLDGTVFDDSYARGDGPLNLPIGVGRVIAGWDEALMDMAVGEKRTLIIPHWLGYGERGSGDRIPPRATLVFEVELLDIR